MSYKKTSFFIPVWYDDYLSVRDFYKENGQWQEVKDIVPRYLFGYVSEIAENKELFSAFSLKALPDVFMCSDEISLAHPPVLEGVRISLFSTGAGFLEFTVAYPHSSLREMADFAYLFKKATRGLGKELPEGSVTLYDCAVSLLPTNTEARIFFTRKADFKYECLCYHTALLDKAEDDLSRQLLLLSRNYNNVFTDFSQESEYDMIYEPYHYDHWAGSPEGLINVTVKTGDHNTDFFLENFKSSHLAVDFHFLYLMLLNQRFSAIQYIHKISSLSNGTQKELEALNARIVKLKTVFSFKIVSDDQIFQNVYTKMYSTLDIDRLLEDIKDNEAQMKQLLSISSVKTDKLSSKFLLGISILSLFSVLIDATQFFDRLNLPVSATLLGFICTLGVSAVYFLWLFFSRNK